MLELRTPSLHCFQTKLQKRFTSTLLRLNYFSHQKTVPLLPIDDSAKRGLTQFWELFTMIPCAPKYLKYRYLKTFGSQIENKGSLKVEEATL